YEAGVYDVVSVPNGASKGNQKLEYLDNCWQDFEDKEKIILCVDSDEAGMMLREELARRLGKERCYTVNYPEGCKDANEVLLTYGKDGLKQMVESAKEWPLEGVIAMEEMIDEVTSFYESGYPDGAKARVEGFDEYLRFIPGQLTIVTGIPGSGKDEFVNLIMSNLAMFEKWPFGICAFEEPSSITVTKLIEKFAGKSFAHRKDPGHRITEDDFHQGVAMVDQYFSFINIDEIDVTMDGILQKATELVKKKGIKGLVINPWNYIEYRLQGGQQETLYISECLTKLKRFLKVYGVHGFLIAHPTKIQKDKQTKKYEVPTLYNISGSAHFFNKTDNGISIYRDFETNLVDVYVQKVKWSWLGKIGFCSFNYDTYTRQYIPA
ncbi:MAG TPA: DnaB-like helicase C-terminal domain-containing protein, partial [Flavisolibacter sp.]|nr:DnaB-like helicase C-terminal domain-containing protein [Flavisolibacter sp.]